MFQNILTSDFEANNIIAASLNCTFFSDLEHYVYDMSILKMAYLLGWESSVCLNDSITLLEACINKQTSLSVC